MTPKRWHLAALRMKAAGAPTAEQAPSDLPHQRRGCGGAAAAIWLLADSAGRMPRWRVSAWPFRPRHARRSPQ